ncbi:MAG TPA: DNA alkylation repair protein [Chitinophagaceae bacterium]|nr:DNA alkylation repair protein [Chitinophagaceae bacterium]
MENVQSILDELKKMGSEQTRKTLMRHGAPENIFGVKVGDMKTIVKRVKKNYELAKGLFDTGIGDAQYLAGLIGDEKKMTRKELEHWAKTSSWSMISEYAVPFVAAESAYAWELGLHWIQSKDPSIASCGWCTLIGFISITPNEKLDVKALEKLLHQIATGIHKAPNRVRYAMNNFIITTGGYVSTLHALALETARKVGEVYVDMEGTACKVPDAASYIQKMVERGSLQKKKKTARC